VGVLPRARGLKERMPDDPRQKGRRTNWWRQRKATAYSPGGSLSSVWSRWRAACLEGLSPTGAGGVGRPLSQVSSQRLDLVRLDAPAYLADLAVRSRPDQVFNNPARQAQPIWLPQADTRRRGKDDRAQMRRSIPERGQLWMRSAALPRPRARGRSDRSAIDHDRRTVRGSQRVRGASCGDLISANQTGRIGGTPGESRDSGESGPPWARRDRGR